MTRTVTHGDLDRSYLSMALLEVAAAAVDSLSDGGVNRQPARLSGSVAAVLRHITELVGETHDTLEKIERRDG